MSSTSRSSDDGPASSPEPEKKVNSPGRYSMADDGDDVPATRVDSTTRMPAVRPELQRPTSQNLRVQVPPSPSSQSLLAAKVSAQQAAAAGEGTAPKKPPPRHQPTQRAMPAPLARGAAVSPSVVPPPSLAAPRAPQPNSLAPGSQAPAVAPPRPPSIVPPAGGRRISSLRPPSSKSPPSSSKSPPSSSKAPASSKPASSKAPSSQPSLLDGFDEGSIAFAFDALVSEGPMSGLPGTHQFDLAPVRELFSALAANHMRHVRDFMIDVKWGEVTRDWIHVCLPPVRTLRRAADRLDLAELGVALEQLGKELDAANAVGGQILDKGEKERLLAAYNDLVTILPQAFALDGDKTQREAVIVQALLLQVPDVRKVTIDKLYAAGLTSLTVLFEANADDIANVAGIPSTLAARIVERVQAYRAELQTASPQDARAAEREKLASLNSQLKHHHDAYETAANGWAADAKVKKRDHFRAREETWLEISVLLARFGEVNRLQGIEKVPFAQRIAQLTDYLEEARENYRSAEVLAM